MTIPDNSNKTFSSSSDDQEKPKVKGFSQNSRKPSAKSEIVLRFYEKIAQTGRVA